MARASVLSNMLWMLSSNLLNNGVNFLVFVVTARYVGASDFGSLSYVFAIASLFSMLGQMGLDGLLSRELLEEPTEERPVILGTAWLLRFFGYLLGALLAIGYGLAMPSHTALERELFLIASLFVFSNVFNSIPENWLKTMHEARSASKARIMGSVTGGILKIGAVMLGGGVVAISLFHLLGLLLISAGMYLFYRRKGGPAPRLWRFSGARARALLGESWRVFASAILWVIYLRIDVMILRQLTDAETVGTYAIATRLAEMSYVLPSALIVASFPSIMAAKQQSAADYHARTRDLLQILSFSGITVMLVIWVFALVALVPLFGAQYAASVPIVMIYMLSTPFMFLHYAVARWILIERQTLFGMIADIIGVLLNIVLNLVLIPRLGAQGAAIATIISYSWVSCFSLLATSKTRKLFQFVAISLVTPWRAAPMVARRLRGALARRSG